MYTSDTEYKAEKRMVSADLLRSGTSYLIASIIVAAAGWLYELFSHGVYSNYMIYAFMVPLACGALPDLLAAARGSRSKKRSGCARAAHATHDAAPCAAPGLRLAAVVTLTTGSLIKGILDIFGTTNRLLVIYLIIGLALAIAALAAYIWQNRAVIEEPSASALR